MKDERQKDCLFWNYSLCLECADIFTDLAAKSPPSFWNSAEENTYFKSSLQTRRRWLNLPFLYLSFYNIKSPQDGQQAHQPRGYQQKARACAYVSAYICVSVCAHEPERREICGQRGMWDPDGCLSGGETGNTLRLGEIKPAQGHL